MGIKLDLFMVRWIGIGICACVGVENRLFLVFGSKSTWLMWGWNLTRFQCENRNGLGFSVGIEIYLVLVSRHQS